MPCSLTDDNMETGEMSGLPTVTRPDPQSAGAGGGLSTPKAAVRLCIESSGGERPTSDNSAPPAPCLSQASLPGHPTTPAQSPRAWASGLLSPSEGLLYVPPPPTPPAKACSLLRKLCLNVVRVPPTSPLGFPVLQDSRAFLTFPDHSRPQTPPPSGLQAAAVPAQNPPCSPTCQVLSCSP